MRAINMQSSATNDAIALFDDHKIANVLADFRKAARQKHALFAIRADQFVNSLGIRQPRVTRAQEPPHRRCLLFSFPPSWPCLAVEAHGPKPCPTRESPGPRAS